MPQPSPPVTGPAVGPRRLVLIIAASLVLSVLLFAPPLSQIQSYFAGHYGYPRTDTYLAQCRDPLRRDVQSSMVWRLLPPLVCHVLRLPGRTPLALPWVGAVALVAYGAVLFRRRLDDWRYVAGGTLLLASTSAVLVPFDFLGFNDAWVWIGLLAVAFGRAAWAVPVACLLCPWVDERFVIGFPLAWLVGRFERGKAWDWAAVLQGLWLVPYALIRLWLGRHDPAAAQATHRFLATYVPQSILLVPMVPIGWWMGLRAGWLAVGYACWTTPRGRRLLGAATFLATGVVTVVLALDLSRSIAIILPAVFLGCFEYARRAPQGAPRVLLALGVANLLLPAASVWSQNVEPVCPLPSELLRLYTKELFKERALENAREMIKVNASPENYLRLSALYYQDDRFEDSLEAAKEALQRRPDYADAHTNVAAAYLAMGRWDEAVAEAREALRLLPDFPLARKTLKLAEARLARVAWDVAKTYLRRIKAPAVLSFGADVLGPDADAFQDWTRNSAVQSDGTYRVKLWADVESGPGAAVRKHYQLTLRPAGAHKWIVTALADDAGPMAPPP